MPDENAERASAAAQSVVVSDSIQSRLASRDSAHGEHPTISRGDGSYPLGDKDASAYGIPASEGSAGHRHLIEVDPPLPAGLDAANIRDLTASGFTMVRTVKSETAEGDASGFTRVGAGSHAPGSMNASNLADGEGHRSK
jgi:hypothetical protein